jgi:hypothetical protein
MLRGLSIITMMPSESATCYFSHTSRTVPSGPPPRPHQYGSPCESALVSRMTYAPQRQATTSRNRSTTVPCRSGYSHPWRIPPLSLGSLEHFLDHIFLGRVSARSRDTGNDRRRCQTQSATVCRRRPYFVVACEGRISPCSGLPFDPAAFL